MSHELELPSTPVPVMRVDTPEPALRSVLSSGGSAYLPRQLVFDELSSGRLHLVPDAPILIRSVFLTRSLLGEAQEEVVAAVDDVIELLSTSQ